MRRIRLATTILASSGPNDTTAPTCTITCNQSSPSSAATLTFTYTWSEDVTGFVIGDAGITGGTKGAFTAVDASHYTLVVTPNLLATVTATVAAGVCTDGAGNANTEATPLSIVSTAGYTLDPSVLSDGALPAGITGSTWAIASGQAVNTPTLGAELVTNGNMETGNPPSNWTTQNDATLTGVADERTGGTGAQSLNAVRGTQSPVAVSDVIANTLGTWYVLKAWIKKGTSNAVIANGSVTGATITSTSWTQSVISYRATSVDGRIYPQATGSAGQSARFDDITHKAITNANELFAVQTPAVNDLVLSVSLNSLGAKAGIVMALDSASNPQNYVVAWIDRRRVYMGKCLSGAAFTNVIAETSFTYVAGAYLTLIKNGTTYTLKYNETQIGTDQTISDAGIVNNTLYGFFSSDPTSPVLKYQLSKLLNTSVKFTYLGDSITAAGGNYAILSTGTYERNGRRTYYTNRSVGGGKVIGSDAADLASQVTAAASDDADKIVILMGTNDSNETDTFRSTYETQVNALKASNPDAHIYLLGILERFDGVTRRNTQNPMIQTVATNTGATYINTDGWIVNGDTTDGLHPTAAGHLKIANQLVPLISP